MTEAKLRISVSDSYGEEHFFHVTGLHEEYEFAVNGYTGELVVERVSYGPRGNDEWARLSSVVVATWPDGFWKSVTQHR